MDNVPWLSLVTWLPAAAAAGLLAVSRKELIKKIALAVSSAVAVGAILLVAGFDAGAGERMQFAESVSWIATDDGALDIRYALGVDGISLAMVFLTALLIPLCVLASWSAVKVRVRAFYAALLSLETGMLGVFMARDLFLFYVFWEAMLIPMILIIGVWGGPRRVYASVKFLVYTMAGSLFMLVGVLYCYFASDGMFDMERLPAGLAGLSLQEQKWLFLAFGIAFAIKVPLFPFHTWLPDAHVEAPTAGSVILAGVLLKMGAYGFLRICIPFFPEGAAAFAPAVVALSVVSILFGALMCMAQSDIKKLIAYSSVSHLGFVMLGLFSFTLAGGQGAVLQMVNHGLSTGALFLLVGILYERAHRRGTDDFGGLAKPMPRYATMFMIVTLSSIGLPGLNGFVGEFLALKGAFETRQGAAVLAALGVVLGAVYMLKLYRDVFWGPVTARRNEALLDASPLEAVSLAPLLVLIVVLGVWPGLILNRTEPAVRAALERVAPPGEYSMSREAPHADR
ncbi:MAG: NADH-quinone oxidoreductase subunit M [Planctomycetes bacterium]|nr:NADH-quinone oxidoreductase subunit M [Planctomycetota bacterium]